MDCDHPKWAPGTSTGLARCSSWRCRGCALWMSRVETRALHNELREGVPYSFLTVTTRDPDTPLEVFSRAFGAVVVRLRRHFGGVEYYGTIEGTSGRRARDGRRRMHGHFVVTGVPVSECRAAELMCRETWEASTLAALGEGGRSFGVTLSPVRSAQALLAYVAGYMGKLEQVMDADWGGRRVRCSQGYFAEGRVLARERAKGELIGEARAWRLGLLPGAQAYEALSAAGGESFVLRREALKSRADARAEFAAMAGIIGAVHDADVGVGHLPNGDQEQLVLQGTS